MPISFKELMETYELASMGSSAYGEQVLPRDFDDVSDMFDRRGAYGRFKQLLTRRRALQQWYDFEQQATERALREWCELNSIVLAD
jgi:hypothetical protein